MGIAQARHKMTREQHYFEMEILSRGESGALAIGVASRTYPLHVHPGWNPGAIGYHADDGKVFIGRGIGEEFGPVCGEGDRMGCGVRYSHTDDEGKCVCVCMYACDMYFISLCTYLLVVYERMKKLFLLVNLLNNICHEIVHFLIKF